MKFRLLDRETHTAVNRDESDLTEIEDEKNGRLLGKLTHSKPVGLLKECKLVTFLLIKSITPVAYELRSWKANLVSSFGFNTIDNMLGTTDVGPFSEKVL